MNLDIRQAINEMAECSIVNEMEKIDYKKFEQCIDRQTDIYEFIKPFFDSFDNMLMLDSDKLSFEYINTKMDIQTPYKYGQFGNITVSIYTDNNVGYIVVIDNDGKQYAIWH